MDLSTSKLVSRLSLSSDDGKLPVLVRNQPSNDATPLAVVFQSGLRRDMARTRLTHPPQMRRTWWPEKEPRLGAPGEQVRGERRKNKTRMQIVRKQKRLDAGCAF